MTSQYSKEQKLVAGIVFGVLISIPLWCYAIVQAPEARQQAQAELSTRTGLDHWWHNNDASSAAGGYYALGVFGTAGGIWVGYLIAPLLLGIVGSVNDSRRAAVAKREHEKLQESVRQMDVESQQQARQMGLAQSKQEVVTRLGTIDQFVRVYRIETEPGRQTVTLQAAQAELTNLNAKVVSGELDAESLKHAEVMECVKETVADLREAGLAGDRLYRDLRRIFRVNDAA